MSVMTNVLDIPRLPDDMQPTIGRSLDGGSFGSMYRVVSQGAACVLKKLHSSCIIVKEIEAYTKVQPVNEPLTNRLPVLLGIYQLNHEYFLLLEYFEQGNLGGFLEELEYYTEKQVQQVVFQVAQALSHLHKKGYTHKSIRPENVLVRSWNRTAVDVVLADFTASKTITGLSYEQYNSRVNRNYRGPELYEIHRMPPVHNFLNGRSMRKTPRTSSGRGARLEPDNYNFKSDVFALGILTYHLLSGGEFPQRQSERDEYLLMKRMKTRTQDGNTSSSALVSMHHNFWEDFEPVAYWNNISNDAKNFISQTITLVPGDRIDYDVMLHENKWLQCDNIDETFHIDFFPG